jgi:hypothetical protein
MHDDTLSLWVTSGVVIACSSNKIHPGHRDGVVAKVEGVSRQSTLKRRSKVGDVLCIKSNHNQ